MKPAKRPGLTDISQPKGPAKITALPGRGARDAALMARIAGEGDRQAYAEIVRHYAPRLKAWLMNRGESGPGAEDIVQDVLIITWQKADMFDPTRANYSTWLFRLTRNKWIDHRRKLGRLVPTEPDIMSDLADSAIGDASEDLEQGETAQRIHREIALLPPEQQQMLQMAFFEGLTHSEISEKSGVPFGTVKTRIRSALRKMRPGMKDHVEFDHD